MRRSPLLWAFLATSCFAAGGCGDETETVIVTEPAPPPPPVGQVRLVPDGVSIQTVIDASGAGDTVVLEPKVYIEDIRLKAGVTVLGNYARTELWGQVFFLIPNASAKIKGVILRPAGAVSADVNGNLEMDQVTVRGGMIRVDGGAQPNIHDSTIDGLDNSNPGILVVNGFATVDHCVIERTAVACDTTMAMPTTPGNFTDTLFWNNSEVFTGGWVGTAITGDPLHTNLLDGQYYVDENSPAILTDRVAGSWGWVDWDCRPTVTRTPVTGPLTGGIQKVLDISFASTGLTGSSVVTKQLFFDITTNHTAAVTVSYRVDEVGPAGTTTLASGSFPSFQNGAHLIWLSTNSVVPVGENRTLQLFLDVSNLNATGDTLEVKLTALRWSDNGLFDNTNGNSLDGFPLNGGILTR